jgi:serine/threonine protein kinase/tetratricopeptide (TPR) repeat protein
MNASFRQVKDIFLAALEKEDASDREAYLSEACASDTGLRGQVEALLHRHEQAGSFLQAPSPTGLVVTADVPITERPGTIIGPYKLMELIGEGGMGLVFVAEQQQPVRRRVALKVIKPGMDTRAVVARFEAERQALALMDHPNIAQVHDGGVTPTGRPYFVMELVKGTPITQFCDEHRLTTRERLELFLHVCGAVQHAHHKGIIHRDIKPTNVMVVSHDGTPVVKVIDFGVAKSIGQQLTDKTVYTQFVQLVGTPLYMSPEQAGESGLDVDTRSDIYSLGVLLYELLTGTTPFNKERLKEASYEEIRRIIREEEPPKPSTRISTLGQAASTVSIQRRSDPTHLRQMIRGELDWVVMKCLEKDRNRRYETANGLAMDVQRYLHDEPVLACPPSAGYRLRKFARKYRTLLRIAGAFVLLLVLGSVVSIWQAVRATRAEVRALKEQEQALKERDRAEKSFHMARDAVDQLFTKVSQSPKLKAQPMEKFRKELLQLAKEFYNRFVNEEFDAPGVRHDLGLAYLRLAEIDRGLGDYPAAEDSLGKAISTFRELLRDEPGKAEYEHDRGAGYAALAQVYFDKGQMEKADAAFEQALAIQEPQAAAYPEMAEYQYALAKTYRALGYMHGRLARVDSALKRHQQALDILNKLVRDHRTTEYQSLLATTQMNLANTYNTKGWFDEAEPLLKEAQRIYEQLVHDPANALPEHRESLGQCLAILGMAYRGQAQTKKAEEAQQRALEILEKLSKEHPGVLDYLYDVGRCYVELGQTALRGGQFDATVAINDKAIEILRSLVKKDYGAAGPSLLKARTVRALGLAARGDHAQATAEAEALFQQEGLHSGHYYDLACTYAQASAAVDRDGKLSPGDRARQKARYADRAMEFLQKAVAEGYNNPQAIKTDPDVDPLRARKDFQELAAELEAKEKESEKRNQKSGSRNQE